MIQNLCKRCRITKSFPTRDLPSSSKLLDYQDVNKTHTNRILLGIYENKEKIRDKQEFLILVDGSRYKIEVVELIKNDNLKIKSAILKQYFMHYDSHIGQLVCVNVRYVEITC